MPEYVNELFREICSTSRCDISRVSGRESQGGHKDEDGDRYAYQSRRKKETAWKLAPVSARKRNKAEQFNLLSDDVTTETFPVVVVMIRAVPLHE